MWRERRELEKKERKWITKKRNEKQKK